MKTVFIYAHKEKNTRRYVGMSKHPEMRLPAFSLEWCANLSESLKGNQRRKGKKDSEETREKKRIASTGRTHTREVREKLRVSKLGKNNPNYGKKRSVESRRKQSEALKLRWKIKKETA